MLTKHNLLAMEAIANNLEAQRWGEDDNAHLHNGCGQEYIPGSISTGDSIFTTTGSNLLNDPYQVFFSLALRACSFWPSCKTW